MTALQCCYFVQLVISLGICVNSSGVDYFKKTIRMPNAVSSGPDDLVCHAAKLDQEETYIVKFEPHASKRTAHHMMVYGCTTPGSTKDYWSCGEVNDHSNMSVCGDGQREIVFAWALDAPSVQLSEGMGLRISGTTSIKYLVIQLHYVDKFPDGVTDDSGITLHMTNVRQSKQVGYYVLGTFGYIPPMTENYHLETACEYKEDYPIYPIGYRTHSHNLGLVISGYKVRNDEWQEIGRMSPQLAQTFYNVTTKGLSIRRGDILASRCTMTSHRNDYTMIGATNKDEMCNFYIMFYTYKRENLKVQYCFRSAQKFHWEDYFQNIPEEASSL